MKEQSPQPRAHHGPEHHFESRLRERVVSLGPDIDLDANAVLVNLARASNIIPADLESHVWRGYGISYAGFRVMFTVWVCGPLEPKNIALMASVTRASISSVLNTLERDGYVVRKRESADRRLVTVELTESGNKLIEVSFAENHKRERRWVECLTPAERRTLADLLQRMLHARPRE